MHATDPVDTKVNPASVTSAPAPGWLTTARFAFILAILIFLAFPLIVLGLRTFVFRDFGLFSYPVAAFARESFWRGELPLWNPLSNCGLPFLAQWNTMVLYPPALIYLLLPLSWSLPLFCLLHMFWGGLGMYCLAGHWTRFKLAGALAGVLFAFHGLSQNFLMWPSHTATFSWLPWVILLTQEAWRTGGRKLVWAIAAGAMQMLAGAPETILVTWLLLGILALFDSIIEPVPFRQVWFRFLIVGSTVTLICATQLLPFLELLKHSQRDSGYAALAQNWPMPIWGWANFLVPLFRATSSPGGVYFQPAQYWTSSYYAGIGAVWLCCIAVWRARAGRVRLLAGFAGVCLVLALGDAGLVYRALRAVVPGLEIVRYPIKFVIPVLALAPLLAAEGFCSVFCERRKLGMFECASAIVLLGATAFIVLSARHASPEVWHATWQNGLSRAAFLVGTVLLLGLFVRQTEMAPYRPTSYTLVLGGLFLLAFYFDLLTHMPNQNPTAAPSVYAPGLTRAQWHWDPGPVLGASRVMISPAAQDALKYRAISDPGTNFLLQRVGLLADCNLIDGVPQVHGFFSLTPGDINDVTAVPYVQTNRNFSSLLDFIGVSDVITEDFTAVHRSAALPLVTAGQEPVFADDRTTFSAFANTNADLSRIVFLPPAVRAQISAQRQADSRVFDTRFTDQKVSFRIETPGRSLAVIAQTWYPAWKAYVDSTPVPLWRANYAFTAVEIPPGKHHVELRYEDRMFRWGLLLSAVGLLITAGLWRFARGR